VLLGVGILSLLVISNLARAEQDVQIFDEEMSFENYVREGEVLRGRSPASRQLKFRVLAVRRELGLTTAEMARAPQDIIINGGMAEGLSEGMVLNVVRKVAVIDPYLDNKQKELEVTFAKVKVVYAQDNLAVARLQNMDSIGEGLAVGVRGVLIGDYLSMK
jgi:hypothetical protein